MRLLMLFLTRLRIIVVRWVCLGSRWRLVRGIGLLV